MKTYEERLVAGLIAIGYSEDETKRTKLRCFIKEGRANKLFVGPNGALRSGKCATKSYSIGNPSDKNSFYLDLLKRGDESFPKTDFTNIGL